MLKLENVTINLKKDGRNITENFNFTLKSNEKAVIIGEEGNGKSTLLKFIYDRKLIENYCDYSGNVIQKGHTAYFGQFLEEKYANLTLCEIFSNSEYYMHTDMLSRLGLSVDFILSEQRLCTLSGGEKVKARLARILMTSPDILLLDEPTNDLDIDTLEWLENFISETRQAVLYISHDETLIEKTANVIVHMEQLSGKRKSRISVAGCSYREYMDYRSSLFTHQNQVAKKQREDYEKKMEKWRRIYDRVDNEQRNISRQDPSGARLLKKKMHSVLSMGKRFEREKENFVDFPEQEYAILTKFDENIRLPAGKAVVDFYLERLCIGERILSNDVKLFVSGGMHIGITGRNGAGKSTLLELLWKELKDRRDIVTAYMPQNYSSVLDFDKTPIEYLAVNRTKDEITKARTYLGSMRFTRDEMSGAIGSLSGGQQAKILFLDMVLRGANVLLLDEPTRNFSPLSCPVVRAALKSFGGSAISVSHDRKFLSEACDEIYELREDGLINVTADILHSH